MPRHAPVLDLRISPRLRQLRGGRSLMVMSEVTGIAVPILSQMERGERFPRFADLEGLERGYGPKDHWYSLTLEPQS